MGRAFQTQRVYDSLLGFRVPVPVLGPFRNLGPDSDINSINEPAKVTCMRKVGGHLLSPVSSRFIFVFALSQFSGPDYLGAWNRLRLSKIRSNLFSG